MDGSMDEPDPWSYCSTWMFHGCFIPTSDDDLSQRGHRYEPAAGDSLEYQLRAASGSWDWWSEGDIYAPLAEQGRAPVGRVPAVPRQSSRVFLNMLGTSQMVSLLP